MKIQSENVVILAILVNLTIFDNCEAKDCYSDYGGKRCLRKDEVGGFAVFVKGGDPCFLFSDKRVIIKYS